MANSSSSKRNGLGSKSKSRSKSRSSSRNNSSSSTNNLRNNRKTNKVLVNVLLLLCIVVILVIIYALFLNNNYCSNHNKHHHNNGVNNLLNNSPNNLSRRNQMNSSTDIDKRVRFNLNNNDVIYIKNNHKLNEHENPNSNNGNHIHIHNHIKTSPHPEYEENRSLLAKDNPNNISVWNKLNHKDHERIINPLLPPERSYVNTYGIPINVPSRGYSRGYQQVGLLYKKDGVEGERQVGNDTSSNILPLFGQAVYPGSNKFNYYVTSDKFNNVKMPFTMNNGKKSDDTYGIEELQDKQEIFIEEYNSNFVVKIYRLDKPRYIPHIL